MTEYEKFLQELETFIFVENKPEKAVIIFVPGNGYPQMAEQAAILYKEGIAPCVLPSGRCSVMLGKFAGVQAKADKYYEEYQTEWDFLKDVLVKNGVNENDILKENRATFTWENAKYSRMVTDGKGISVKKAIICCKTYHARRALMYYQKVYPETEFLVCPSEADGINRRNWKNTEEGILAVTGEATRIINQFSLMME